MKKRSWRYGFLLLLGFGAVVCSAATGRAAIDPRLEAVLAEAGTAEGVPVIATFRSGSELPDFSRGPRQARRAELVRALKSRAGTAQGPAREFLRGRGVGPIKDLWVINGLAVTATPETIRALAARPEVASVRLDAVIPVPRVAPAQSGVPAEANIVQVQAPRLWQLGVAGQGVTVATMDSGVDLNHPDLGPRWRGGSNSWFDPSGEHPGSPVDLDGHGSAVMGVLVGGDDGGTAIGVAPGARWIAVKVFNDAGLAPYSSLHQGFGWLLDPDGNPATDDAPDVVNNSWGFEETPGVCDPLAREFETDVRALRAAGIAVVFAAGNTGPDANTSVAPANYPESFAVGSVGTLQSPTAISDFSACGPSTCDGTVYPEVVAPGFVVRTAGLTAGGTLPNAYVHVAGTSYSAPHVSGVMALLLSAFPGIPVDLLETAVRQSSVDLGAAGPDNVYGHGLVDALAAFNVLSDSVGVAALAVSDPVPPADDLSVDFGSVPPGQTAVQILTLHSAGNGSLTIQGFGSPQAPFALAADGCSGQTLAAGASCAVSVRFAPTAHAAFAARLDILSNDPEGNILEVALLGAGNTPPPAPQLTAPASGATGVDTTVLLEWSQRPDADGDVVTNLVFLSTSEDFSQIAPIEVASAASADRAVLYAGGGGFLLVFGVAVGLQRRKWRLLAGCLAAAGLLLLLACGGGGGSGGDLPGEARSRSVSGLEPATPYFWKVAAGDAFGYRTESAVGSFTTR